MSEKEYNFVPGQRLVLELQSEIVEGEYDSGSRNRIDLINITDRVTKIQVKDKFSFYRNEIVSIRCIDVPAVENNASENVESSESKPLTEAEYSRLKELTKKFVYINKVGDEYKDAVKRLQACERIGIVGLCGKSKIEKLKILVLTTPSQIYLFDLFVWDSDAFPSELNMIINSAEIEKIVHDSSLLYPRLLKCRVKLENIFDTQVADAMIHKRDTGEKLMPMKDLSKCLVQWLQLPEGLVEQIENVDDETWDKRPMDYHQVIQASFLATYLITLRNLLCRSMLKHFYNCVELSLNYLTDELAEDVHTATYLDEIPDTIKEYLDKVDNLFM